MEATDLELKFLNFILVYSDLTTHCADSVATVLSMYRWRFGAKDSGIRSVSVGDVIFDG